MSGAEDPRCEVCGEVIRSDGFGWSHLDGAKVYGHVATRKRARSLTEFKEARRSSGRRSIWYGAEEEVRDCTTPTVHNLEDILVMPAVSGSAIFGREADDQQRPLGPDKDGEEEA